MYSWPRVIINREVVLLLLDSDAARKLCQFDLIQFLITAMSFDAEDLGILPQLKFQLRIDDEKKSIQKIGSKKAYENAIELIASAFEVEVSVSSANPILGLDRPDLETGELTLFAALADTDQSHLLSGDKRAYIALSKVNQVDEIHELWPRLICLEEAMLIIIFHHNFSTVSDRVRTNPQVDKAIALTFGISSPSSKDNVIEALNSYIGNLQHKTSGKFIPITSSEKAFQI